MTYMRRKLAGDIRQWKDAGDTKPLLIRGARRIGKTFLIEQIAHDLFDDDMVKLDFQTDLTTIEKIFDVPTNDTEAIINRIREYTGKPCEPQSTLLFFDEIQLSDKALNSLRFFSGTQWRVIATGSLLGVTVKKRRLPFPSGVRQLDMFPMDFEEFLWAVDEQPLAKSIRDHAADPRSFMLHDRALDWYHRYLVIGGMPKAVDAYRTTRSFASVMQEQHEINDTYVNDMTDPDNGISGISAKRIWDSLQKQLLRSSTKKFKYADVIRGGRRERLLEPLEWLEAAGIVSRNDMTKDSEAPLTPYCDEEGSFFKIYVADTGIMFSKFGIDAELLLRPDVAQILSSDFRGALAENYAMQSLKAAGLHTFYWTPAGNGQGELDFVFQNRQAQVIPVEIKSARNVTAKSLRRFVEEGHSPRAYRLSERDFGIDTVAGTDVPLISLPLYAAFALDQEAGERNDR
ncbi:ATP-binding protein [Bifidobacterium sp. SO1]|uniref:ATP-binding protein n=1 Tax=Bifidobacterium sp. SO1 TaxID=2809029 RepID=UPI001BDD7ECD|nr:ATP-binding protein [Bifidobacterium sp. SO1]MBT1162286.1 ATP-binding protein [Bifidobacterium sp. SO1]